MRAHIACALALTALLSLSCNRKDSPTGTYDSPSVAPVEEVIGTAAPIGYAVTLAMAAAAGTVVPCVSGTFQCAFPCTSSIDISVSTSCALPIGDSATGTVHVAGSFTSANDAVLTAVFTGVTSRGNRHLLVTSVTTLAAHRSGDTITIAYTDQNVTLGRVRGVSVSTSAWAVKVNTNGTLGDLSDDQITVSGNRTEVEGINVISVTLAGVEIGPACRRNPVDGTATIEAIAGLHSGTAVLSFHGTCDARVDISGGTGVYSRANGDQLPLDLLN
jgi:hypothetical protein